MTLIPIIIGGRCLGHILGSARGYRLFDHNDVELGTFPTKEAAVAGLSRQEVA
jgi:hypothetical protein